MVVSDFAKMLELSGLDSLIRNHVDECNRDFLPVDDSKSCQWIFNLWGMATCFAHTRALKAREYSGFLGMKVDEIYKDTIENRALRPFLEKYKDHEIIKGYPMYCKKGLYIADAFFPAFNTILEIDESYHATKKQKASDHERHLDIDESHGYTIIRYSPKIGDEVRRVQTEFQLDAVIAKKYGDKCQEGTSTSFDIEARDDVEIPTTSRGDVETPISFNQLPNTDMSVLEFYLRTNPIKRKYIITYCVGKCVELTFFKKCFSEHHVLSHLNLDEQVLSRYELKVSFEKICKSCKSIWKGVQGKCSECSANRPFNRGPTKQYIVGMTMTPC